MPKISVIMPAYNAGQTLGASVESILNQSFGDFELIVIDDASEDETAILIEGFISRDARVRSARNDRNLGITRTRNLGLSMAKGDYVAWQDADDISLPDRLSKQVAFLESHPEVALLGGYLQLFDATGDLGLRTYPLEDDKLRRMMFRFSPVAQPSAMVRMAVLRQVGYFDESLNVAEDLDMSFRIAARHRLANLDEALIRYRNSQTSSTRKRLREMELVSVGIRFRAMRSGDFRVSGWDLLYNLAHLISIGLIPPGIKLWLFERLRTRKSTSNI